MLNTFKRLQLAYIDLYLQVNAYVTVCMYDCKKCVGCGINGTRNYHLQESYAISLHLRSGAQQLGCDYARRCSDCELSFVLQLCITVDPFSLLEKNFSPTFDVFAKKRLKMDF